MLSRYPAKKNKRCVKNGYFWFWVNLCSRKLIQGDKDYKVDRDACTDSSFSFVKFDPRTWFLLQYQFPSSWLVLCYYSRRISYPTKAQTKLNFFEVETAIKMKLHKLVEQLNQRNNRAETMMDFVDDCIVESEEQDLSTQFQHMQKNQLIALEEDFERYCIVMPVFGFNSAKINHN